MTRMHRRHVIVTCLLALAVALHARADWTLQWEHWYTLEIAGSPAGTMYERTERDGDRWRTARDTHMRIARGDTPLEVSTTSAFVETGTGEPVELRYQVLMSQQQVDTTWTFDADARVVHSVARQGPRALEREAPWPEGDWLTPLAARRFWIERNRAGAEEIQFATIDGEAGLEPIHVTLKREGVDRLEVDGREIPVTVWTTTTSALPGVEATSRYTEDGFMVSEEMTVAFGRLVTRLASADDARRWMEGPAPELMLETFVAIDEPIAHARQRRQLDLIVRSKSGDLPDLPSAGAQRFVREGASQGRLSIDVDNPLPASSDELEAPKFLDSSTMVDASDELIRKLSARAVRGMDDDRAAKAEALRRFVHGHISAKALDTGFATASEVARMRTGDCSEHGILLCALLRAQGIPARVATGLVYADSFAGRRDIFGWHMWTQALIGGAWIDLDATLDGTYDAAHVLTGTSALEEGASDLNSVILLIGNLDLEVADGE